MAYPTWIKINAKRWQSAEQLDGTPDFIATHESDGWRLKWRSSSQAVTGFRAMGDVKTYVMRMDWEQGLDTVATV